jgi:hypothetical protein
MISEDIVCNAENGLFVQFPSDIFSFKFPYTTNNFSKKIESFDFGRQEKKLKIVQLKPADSTSYFDITIAQFFNKVTARSVAQKKPAKIWVGDWYIECYFIGGGKNNLDMRVERADYDLTIAIEDPFWKRKTVKTVSTSGKQYIDNRNTMYPADFILEIKGSTTDAYVNVFDRSTDTVPIFTYGADTSLSPTDTLIIDTEAESIQKKTMSGNVASYTNMFNSRYTDDKNDIYDKLPYGSFYFDMKAGDTITLIERAAQMPWWDAVSEVSE